MLDWGKLAAWVFPMGTQGVHSPLLPIARRHAWSVPVVTALGVLASGLEGFGVGILVPLLSLLLYEWVPPTLPAPIRWLVEQTEQLPVENRILAIGATIVVLILLRGVVQGIGAWLVARIEGQAAHDMRLALAERILSLGYPHFLANDFIRFVDVISTASWEATKAVRWAFAAVTATTSLVMFAGLLAWLDWRLFMVVLGGVAVVGGFLFLLERTLKGMSFAVVETNRRLAERMLTIVRAIRPIRIFGQQAREQARFAESSEEVRQSMQRVQRVSALMVPVVETMVSALFILVLLAAILIGVSFPVASAFVVLLARAQPHARTISEARLGMASVRGSVVEVEWLLGLRDPPAAALQMAERPDTAKAAIRFDDVTYAYPSSEAGVSGVSFTIRPGVATALIGRSGSGKSTLVNLLCRFIDPQAGVIRVGEHRLDRIDPAAWQRGIGLAGQDIDLVDGTIAENIAYGRPDATRAEIEDVARHAGAHAFIEQLPAGYGTRVNLEGLSLSGGQRQRIGLARALLKRPDLLILDEATNAVDGISEMEIMRLLAQHRHFRTALVISHRRSTLAACQDGIVIEEGRVVEAGPLEALDYYRRMAGEPHPAR